MAPNPVARFFDQDLEPRAVTRLPVPLPLPMNCGIAYLRDDPRKKNIAGLNNLLR